MSALGLPVGINCPVKDGCQSITNGVKCPIPANTKIVYNIEMDILDKYPEVSYKIIWQRTKSQNQNGFICSGHCYSMFISKMEVLMPSVCSYQFLLTVIISNFYVSSYHLFFKKSHHVVNKDQQVQQRRVQQQLIPPFPQPPHHWLKMLARISLWDSALTLTTMTAEN